MGHATAEDMANVFENATSNLNHKRMLQPSMDGPNVNFSSSCHVRAAFACHEHRQPKIVPGNALEFHSIKFVGTMLCTTSDIWCYLWWCTTCDIL